MYKIADKYVLPQLKAGARNEIFMQPDQELENMEEWYCLLNELHQMSRRDEKGLREGAIKKVAEMPRSTIEEHDELKVMLSAKPSYARDVIHYLRNQLQINEDKSSSSRGGRTAEKPTSLSRGSTIGDIRLSREGLGGSQWSGCNIITNRRNGWPANVGKDIGGSHYGISKGAFRQQVL